MFGSSEAAKKLSPKRTAFNLCKITLSRWKRNWVSRASPDRCEILWPRARQPQLGSDQSTEGLKKLNYAKKLESVLLLDTAVMDCSEIALNRWIKMETCWSKKIASLSSPDCHRPYICYIRGSLLWTKVTLSGSCWLISARPVSYTHLTLPTNREV